MTVYELYLTILLEVGPRPRTDRGEYLKLVYAALDRHRVVRAYAGDYLEWLDKEEARLLFK